MRRRVVDTGVGTLNGEQEAAQTLQRRVFRRNAHRLMLPVLYLVPIFIFGLFAVQTTPFLWIGAAFWVWLGYRTLTMGVFTSTDGVVVRNIMRSRRLSWAETVRFDWGSWGGFPIGGAYLVDGSFVRASALNPPFEFERGQNKAVPKALMGLNRELERARCSVPGARARIATPVEEVGAPLLGDSPDQLTLE